MVNIFCVLIQTTKYKNIQSKIHKKEEGTGEVPFLDLPKPDRRNRRMAFVEK